MHRGSDHSASDLTGGPTDPNSEGNIINGGTEVYTIFPDCMLVGRPKLENIASKSESCSPPSTGEAYACKPNARASSSSAKSSSTSMTRCNELVKGGKRPPCPSKPIALVKRGKSKSSLRPASSSAVEIVCSVLLEMMKSRMPAFRKAHSHGFSKGALLRRSSPL